MKNAIKRTNEILKRVVIVMFEEWKLRFFLIVICENLIYICVWKIHRSVRDKSVEIEYIFFIANKTFKLKDIFFVLENNIYYLL